MTTMTNHRVLRRLVAAIAIAFLLALTAGCGDNNKGTDGGGLPVAADASSSAPSGDGSDQPDLDPQDAMLKYAQCMREHGIDMPDPQPGGGISLDGAGHSEEEMQAAQDACQKWMDMAEPDDGGHELTEEEKQSFLDMAQCMRDRGYDFPDPIFNDGRVTQKVEKGEGNGNLPGPDDPAFQKDMEECSAEAGLDAPGGAHGGVSTSEKQS
jgi:hypothetical protein